MLLVRGELGGVRVAASALGAGDAAAWSQVAVPRPPEGPPGHAWRRRLITRTWDYTSRRNAGRPSTPAAIRKLVIRMATDNPTLLREQAGTN